MSKEITFTQYMNRSLAFRNGLTQYCIGKGYEAQTTRNVLHLLDKMDTKSKHSIEYRKNLMEWFNGKSSTLTLRDFAEEVGYNYWGNLTNSNIIDTFDAYSCKFKTVY